MKHTAMFKLPDAQARYRIAVEECPHWDYDDDGPGGHACCVELQEAIANLRHIKAAIKKETGKGQQ